MSTGPRLVESAAPVFDPIEDILADLAATGWTHEFDAMRATVAKESRAVRDFSDECRFWVAHRA